MNMTYQTIAFEVRDDISWITLNRPDAYNAMSLDFDRELYDVANRCSLDRTVRAVILTGAGDQAFCAGGDVACFADSAENIGFLIAEMTDLLHAAVSRFARMDAPLIGCVNGIAAGAGLSLVACCDLVLAADTARFISAYTRIGFTPDGSSTYFLSRIIGIRRAMEMYITNRMLSAQEALDWGLVNRIVPATSLKDETHRLAKQLAQGPTRTYGGVKKLLMMAMQDSLESQMAREARQLIDISASHDAREGVRAFIEKRQPIFQGS